MYIKKLCKYLFIFCTVLLSMVMLLVLTALLPRSAIENNSVKSALYLSEKEELFHVLVENQKLTTLDNYADAISLNIVYSLEATEPLKSALLASYYKEEWLNTDEAYKIAVTEHKAANKPYTRYWHGSMIFLKPLLMFFDIRGIRCINSVVMLTLILILGRQLIKKKQKLLLSALSIGFIAIGVFIVPLCIEYTSTFIIMLVACIAVLLIEQKGEERLLPLFFITGMLTCFFDFLTTETITLTLPLVILLCIRVENGGIKTFRSGLRLIAKSSALWAVAYMLMWLSKWTLSSMVLGTNSFIEALDQAQVRTIGAAADSLISQWTGAVFRNIALLFPLNFGKTYGTVMLLLLGVFFFVFCIIVLYRKKLEQVWFLQLLMLVATVPYVRYFVLSNHAYLHYFFTYRAQLVTVTVIIYALFRCLDKKLIAKDLNKIKSIIKI